MTDTVTHHFRSSPPDCEEYINHGRLDSDGVKNDHGEFARRVISTLLRHEAIEHTEYT